LYDISPTLSESTAVFPGDTKFKQEFVMSFEQDHHLDLCTLTTTSHIGAHTDAPRHYSPEGKDMASRDLNYYIGEAQVISTTLPPGGLIQPEHLPKEIKAERILFKTGSFPNPDQWTDYFNAVAPETIKVLAEAGVKLIGIDTPSIDPAQSKELLAHQEVYAHDLAILEGIVLTRIPEGVYELIALPLKIKDGDASPVRAILRDL
jgi:arylformamidase